MEFDSNRMNQSTYPKMDLHALKANSEILNVSW